MPDDAEADLTEMSVRLIAYAKDRIRFAAFTSVARPAVINGELTIDGKSALDFAQVAIAKFGDGRRKWNPEACPDFLMFLKGVVRSLISNAARRSAQHSQVDITTCPEAEGTGDDLGNKTLLPPDKLLIMKEEEANRHQFWKDFKMVLHRRGDEELLCFIEALEIGWSTTVELSKNTGIAEKRIYELRRKLNDKMSKFYMRGRDKYNFEL
jgi:hypothetical protein